jgi:molecular chaperone DnaJ
MVAKRDYYEVLGIQRGASPEDIKRAYRQRARETHPDVNREPSAAQAFKEVNEAYEVLNDPQKRAAYDRFGHSAVNGGFGADPFGGFEGFPDMADIFEIFTGGGFRSGRSRQAAPRRGADIGYRLTISFDEAIFGTEKEIEYDRTEICPRCDGHRAEPGTSPTRCTTCSGTGEVRNIRNTFLGQMVNIVDCPDCQGRGEVVTSPCRECTGRGVVRRTRRKIAIIPGGVDNGTTIRLSGDGEPGLHGGPTGNLMLEIQVKAHPYFRRRGDDLIVKLQINIAQAALGHTLTVPVLTPQGEAEEELHIPPGTQSGEVFVIKKKGVPRLRRDGTHSGFGDMSVMVEVVVPTRLTAEQRTLFQQLSGTLGDAVIPPAQEKGFFERMRDWLGGE